MSGHLDVGAGKILALEKKRFAASGGQRIGKAIAVIQARRMPSLAEFPPRYVSLPDIDRGDLDAGLVQPQVELCSAGLSQTGFDHRR